MNEFLKQATECLATDAFYRKAADNIGFQLTWGTANHYAVRLACAFDGARERVDMAVDVALPGSSPGDSEPEFLSRIDHYAEWLGQRAKVAQRDEARLRFFGPKEAFRPRGSAVPAAQPKRADDDVLEVKGQGHERGGGY